MGTESVIKITAAKADSEQRLDLFTAIHQNLYSRAALRRLINVGKVSVNGRVEYRPNYRVQSGDEVSMEMASPEEPVRLYPEDLPLEIIYEDQDLLVVNKPSGMVIHPATGNTSGTLMNAVMFHLKNSDRVGDQVRSGLVHRIDKDTSGLVLIGKTNKGLWYYSRLFAERKVQKTYIAITAGNMVAKFKDGNLVVKNFLGRNPKQRKKIAIVGPDEGKSAETELELVKLLKINKSECSAVLAFPKTGRTHQIRIHLCSLGHPVLGDVIYGRHNKFPRLLLHAWKLDIKLLNGTQQQLEAPLPEIFTELLA